MGSKIISYFTRKEWQKRKDTPSHTAILFFDKIVFHSNMGKGVHVEPFVTFKKKNKIINSLKKTNRELTYAKAWELFETYAIKTWGSEYDKMGILYFAWRQFLNYFFKVDMPKHNKWEDPDDWFCDELLEEELDRDISMTSPNELMMQMEANPHFVRCELPQ